MDEGFILSNKYRRSIFDELASGETDINRIAKKHRIIIQVAERVNRYILTDKGEKLAISIR